MAASKKDKTIKPVTVLATEKFENGDPIHEEPAEEIVEQGHSVEQMEHAICPETHPELYDDFGNLK